ncbi:MAG: hypothetical protein DHS20C12_21850 [Pseudohongiella sp.]|nr:MAG: hypothetical protein DHS20C12_21850 [Pseudohongiella sp.]
MSFNVTQCPACESTFNTNSRVLAAAAGRVRCGACLNVFEAIDNFLLPEETDAADGQDESVFVGNDPQEFFDPSSFLTRSALREPPESGPIIPESLDEQDLHQELEQTEVVNEDFFASVAEELQEQEEEPEAGITIQQEEPQPKLPESLTASLEDNPALEDSIDEVFEREILDSFAEQPEQLDQSPTQGPLATGNQTQSEAEIEPEADVAEHPVPQQEESYLNVGLSASFTFNHGAPPEVRIGDQGSDSVPEKEPEETIEDWAADENEDAPRGEEADERTSESPAEPNTQSGDEAQYSEAVQSAEPAVSMEPDSHVDSRSDSGLDAEPYMHNEVEETELEQSESTGEPSEEAPQVFAEPDVQVVPDEAEIEQEAFTAERAAEQEPETPNEEEQEEQEELRTDQADADEEEDSDSTEAIRARALEAELSDEEALEAIPKENLAALGSMSTPLELLSRKESRLLRSTLLFLSILILGGLLSAQYLWQRMDLYSQLAQLRPLYEFACGYLDCELPDYADIDAIRSENLTVQSHPTLDNGLLVNTVIRNTAPVEQPFPILILSFNSAENSVVALREFTSDEYLDEGLRSITMMPAGTPVQISLALIDPGPGAVNYTLAFRWP